MPTSPFQHLIPELLGQIFLDCLPQEQDSNLCNPSVFDAPIKLGLICSHWRKVAIATQALWCRYGIQIPDISQGYIPASPDYKYAQAMNVFNSRSGSRPLDILIWYKSQYQMPLIKSEVISSLRRLESLTLHTPREFAVSILKAMGIGAPLLRILNVHSQEGYEMELDLDHVPNLSYLRFVLGQHFLKSRSKPLSQIRHLQLSNDSYSIKQWIHNCPTVERLDLAVLQSEHRQTVTGISEEQIMYQLPFLTSLKLQCVVPSEGLEFSPVERVIAPALRSLNLNAVSFSNAALNLFFSLFLDFLRISNPPLENLTIRCSRPVNDVLKDILAAVPSVETLRLENDAASAAIMVALTYPPSFYMAPGQPILCPNLRKIELTPPDNLDKGVLVDLLVSRWRPVWSPAMDYESTLSACRQESSNRLEAAIIRCESVFKDLPNDPIIANRIAEGLQLAVSHGDCSA